MNKKGFTLIEMLVVLAILAITALIATPSLVGYARQAEQINRTETAKTIYLAAQNYMTRLNALGNLKSAYEGEVAGKYFTDNGDELVTSLLQTNNVYSQIGESQYPLNDIENGRSNYIRYLSKPSGVDRENPLYLLLSPAIRDEAILNGAILLEYNILTGKILSVFYSDLDEVTEFNYSSSSDELSNIYGNRAELYNATANERRQGYYGVDYTGTTAPERTVQLSIYLYDGYDDNQSDISVDGTIPAAYRFNKPLYNINEVGKSLQNVLYAEILVAKDDLSNPFDLVLNDKVILKDIMLSDFAENETMETAIERFDSYNSLIFRNDNPIVGTINDDFARFVWVIDYLGGDVSSANDNPFKYSISQLTDVNPNANITVSVVQGTETVIESNAKNPYFSTEYWTDGTATNMEFLNQIATTRHLNNIRFTTALRGDFNRVHNYIQVDDIDASSDNNVLSIADFDELILAPLPELHGSYSGLFNDNNGNYSIKNLTIINPNPSPDSTTESEIAGRSVGLFEGVAMDGEVAHLTFIDPTIIIENLNTATGYVRADLAKYAGVVAGYSVGTINHITVISSSDNSPVQDNDPYFFEDAGVMYSDYVGGIVGMVGDCEKDSIHHILYLAVAPEEGLSSSVTTYVRYNSPIVGTNYQGTNPNTTNKADTDKALTAVDDDSCFFLIGESLRPTDDDPQTTQNINVAIVTDGLGQPISTNELYDQMQNNVGEFYSAFIDPDNSDGGYGFITGITDPISTTSIDYPYPFYGVIQNVPSDYPWPITYLEPFKAEFIYYEIYGDITSLTIPVVGYYQLDDDGSPIDTPNPLLDDAQRYFLLSDGYAIKVNRPYTMLEEGDLSLTINDVKLDSAYSLLYRHSENPQHDEFTDLFRSVSGATDIESLLTINNTAFQNVVNNAIYNDYADIINIGLSNGDGIVHSCYINPLFAKAMYNTMPNIEPQDMAYSVRSARHLDNIGRFSRSTSHLSSFVQQRDINLSNYGATFGRYPTQWSYNNQNAANIYTNVKYGSPYVGGSGLETSGSIAATIHPFAGEYNGNGYKIYNYNKTSTGYNTALFNNVAEDGVLQNMLLDNFKVSGKGLTLTTTLAANNSGNLKDITVSNSTISADIHSYNGNGSTIPPGINRPIEVGGVVAINDSDGVIENVRLVNSTITRAEAGTGSSYNPNERGAGGIVGENSGLLQNSGVINSTISVKDNYVGGLVGLSLSDGVIKNCYFVNNSNTGDVPINYNYDSLTPLVGENPSFNIGGIIGGGIGTVEDCLYLAAAPQQDVTDDDIADEIYPITAKSALNINLINNIYLSGSYFSRDKISWQRQDYNTLPAHGTADQRGLIGLAYEFINQTWLANHGNNQLSEWQNTTPYPTAPGESVMVNAPYATDRPGQHTDFVNEGELTDGIISAVISFNGKSTTQVLPGDVITVEVTITNASDSGIDITDINKLDITFGQYSDYLNILDFVGITPNVITLSGVDTTSVPYIYNSSTNSININTDALRGVISSGESMGISFDLAIRERFSTEFIDISTLYYYAALQLGITLDEKIYRLNSEEIYIEPFTLVGKVFNNGAPINSDESFSSELTIATANDPMHLQKGTLIEMIPAGLSIDENMPISIDDGVVVTVLNKNSDYTLVIDESTGSTELKILNIEIAQDEMLTLSYTLKNNGEAGTFYTITKFDKTAYSNINTLPIAQSAPMWYTALTIKD